MAMLLRQVRQCRDLARAEIRFTTVRYQSYEQHQDKISVRIMNKEEDIGIMVDSFSPDGFRLNNGFKVVGPCALFPRSILHWNVGSHLDINEDSVSLFTMLEPKIDILVLGVGDRGSQINMNVINYLRSKKISVEVLSTETACSTFNFLNAEKRYVAAGLIPPSGEEMDYHENFIITRDAERKLLYSEEEKSDKEAIEEFNRGPEKLLEALKNKNYSNQIPFKGKKSK